MRKAILILFVAVVHQVNAQKMHVEAGANYSSSDDVDAGIGYFAGVGVSNMLTDKVGYTASALYMNEGVKFEDIRFEQNALSALFAFKFYIGEKFNLQVGAFMQYAMSIKVDGEDAGDPERGHMGLIAGASYELNRIAINARFLPYIDNDKFFNNTAQLGVSYRIWE